MTVKRYDAHTNADDFKSDWHESKDGPMLKYEDYAKLAAENAALKSGAVFFSYGSEHDFELHKTAKDAAEAAEAAIDDYRGDACDGWSDEVDSICWGVVMQSSTKVGERPRTKDDHCDPAIETICDYALLPSLKNPITKSFLAEVRAQGVKMFVAFCGEENSVFVEGRAYYRSLPDAADEFATQLRQEASQ
ncbi:hypothetical protein ACLEYI_06305 [Enterobacter ludwigii]|uniref:hypothetical protein n=1 Tax=Enterobacter ludwigii TaxID=299767 RepID=UPI003976226A